MKFVMQGAQYNGEFFTPQSLVQTIVNVIEPSHGIILDPTFGYGGMAVQTGHFIEQQGKQFSHEVTFYGQEYKTSNLRLAKMNLAVRGLEGDVVEANSFYTDSLALLGKYDFVMANPPFNVDMVDAEKAKRILGFRLDCQASQKARNPKKPNPVIRRGKTSFPMATTFGSRTSGAMIRT
jgi:type I restriction enzyme M protein